MKKIVLTLLFLLLFIVQASACDICGCGVGNFNPYMFPYLSKYFVSFGYTHRYYYTHAHDELGNEMLNKETYRTYLLTGQILVGKRLQLMVALPFQSNEQSGPEGVKSLNRPGDVIILANYRLLDEMNSHSIRQTIMAGAGVKLPTGGYHFEDADEKQVGNPNFQAGTGSTDILLNGSYNIRYKKWAATAACMYKINSENKGDYRFGNRTLGIVQLKYIQDIGKFSLIPHGGLTYENMKMDKMNGAEVEHTGGNNLQLSAGLDINNKNWAIGFIYQKPISQNLGEGHIQAMPGINLHLSYSF